MSVRSLTCLTEDRGALEDRRETSQTKRRLVHPDRRGPQAPGRELLDADERGREPMRRFDSEFTERAGQCVDLRDPRDERAAALVGPQLGAALGPNQP